MGLIAGTIVHFPLFEGAFMKLAKQRPPHQMPLPTAIGRRSGIAYRTRESRLIHQMARNSPTENQRLGKVIARQRHRLRHAIGVARRYARQIACLTYSEQQAIRQLQDSPFYVGLGAAWALQREDIDEPSDIDDLDWLFDEEEGSDA